MRDADIRKRSFEALEEAWEEKEDFFASALNHIAGFRLEVYKKRGWDSVLKEPLLRNRMSEETLDAMWGAIGANKEPFVEYLNVKAKMLGTEKMNWYDIDAPVTASTKEDDLSRRCRIHPKTLWRIRSGTGGIFSEGV